MFKYGAKFNGIVRQNMYVLKKTYKCNKNNYLNVY